MIGFNYRFLTLPLMASRLDKNCIVARTRTTPPDCFFLHYLFMTQKDGQVRISHHLYIVLWYLANGDCLVVVNDRKKNTMVCPSNESIAMSENVPCFKSSRTPSPPLQSKPPPTQYPNKGFFLSRSPWTYINIRYTKKKSSLDLRGRRIHKLQNKT